MDVQSFLSAESEMQFNPRIQLRNLNIFLHEQTGSVNVLRPDVTYIKLDMIEANLMGGSSIMLADFLMNLMESCPQQYH